MLLPWSAAHRLTGKPRLRFLSSWLYGVRLSRSYALERDYLNIGQIRQLIDGGRPVFNLVPVMGVQETAELLQVEHLTSRYEEP